MKSCKNGKQLKREKSIEPTLFQPYSFCHFYAIWVRESLYCSLAWCKISMCFSLSPSLSQRHRFEDVRLPFNSSFGSENITSNGILLQSFFHLIFIYPLMRRKRKYHVIYSERGKTGEKSRRPKWKVSIRCSNTNKSVEEAHFPFLKNIRINIRSSTSHE